jgi:hypothetical protein
MVTFEQEIDACYLETKKLGTLLANPMISGVRLKISPSPPSEKFARVSPLLAIRFIAQITVRRCNAL